MTETYVFDKGADLAPTFGVFSTLIEQAIERATPNAYRGMVIRSNTVPATVGQPTGYPTNWYTFQRRSLWVKDNGETYFYNGVTWEYIRCRPASLAVDNSMIADATIQIGKFSSIGGNTSQLIRVAAAGGFEYVDAINSISVNTFPVDRLVAPATGTHILRTVTGVKAWAEFNSTLVVGAIDNNSIAVNKLARGSALQVPMVASDGNSVVWSSVVAGIADGALSIGKIATSVGDAGKFLKYGTDGKLVAVDSGVIGTNTALVNNDKIVAIDTAGAVKNAPIGKYDSGLITFTGAAYYEGNHGLSGTPSIAQAWLECVTGEHGYNAGDRVAIYGFDYQAGNDQRPAFQFMVNSTKWSVTVLDIGVSLSTALIYVRTTGNAQPINPARWRLRVILTNI